MEKDKKEKTDNKNQPKEKIVKKSTYSKKKKS